LWKTASAIDFWNGIRSQKGQPGIAGIGVRELEIKRVSLTSVLPNLVSLLLHT
jgi:hypothetical protein